MKKILLAATGLSPQIITESLYALAVQRDEPFVPDEIHLITTKQGAERARLELLTEPDGWFHQLRSEYGLPPILFDESHIHILADREGSEINDIRTPEDNAIAADGITQLVAKLTRDEHSILHVSIAGGRKTMSFYLGYALSLFGRQQDEMSHVLVSHPYESLPQFFYPSRNKRVIHTRDNEPLDASAAEIWLANIPFVRMRHGIPAALRSGEASFSDVVGAASMAFEAPRLRIHLRERKIVCGELEVPMPPAELAFYTMMAERRMKGLDGLACPRDLNDDALYAREYLKWYKLISGEIGGHERTEDALKKGMSKSFFEQRKSICNKRVRQHLATSGSPYEIRRSGKKECWRFGLSGLDATRIGIK